VAYYRFWWEDGRQRKQYVRRADLRETRDACRRHRDALLEERAMLRYAKQVLQYHAARLQEIEQHG
jgi:hypothetical protein